MKEVPKQPVLTVMEMKQRRDQLCFACGQRSFNKAVLDAENLKDHQEMLELSQKIALAEKEPVKEAPIPEVLPADPETPKIQ